MKIPIDIPVQVKGIITVQAHSPSGELLHEEVQDNLIVTSGFQALALGNKLGDSLLNTCILGRDATPPSLSDAFYGGAHGFVNGITDLVCDQEFAGDSFCPFPQDRSVVAVSTNNGGTADVYDRVSPDAAPYWWRLTRKRIFTYDDAYFIGGDPAVLADTCMAGNQFGDWVADGWGSLEKEASYIAEVGFCSSMAIEAPFNQCPPDPSSFKVPAWAGENLWNRVVLSQSIGYETGTPWATPDVVLATDAIITVTMELRFHLTTATVTQIIDVDGTPTTVRTRVQNRWDVNTWAEGVLRNFGYWRGDARAGRIGEDNTLPGTTSGYNSSSDVSSASTVSSGADHIVRKYTIDAGVGNFATGLGGIAHGNFRTGSFDRYPCFATVFDPKIPKDATAKLEIVIRYTWEQWSA